MSDEPKTRMRGSERRALILAQTTKVFAERGYADASIGDLARASGVTEPMLYKHFGSKHQLFLAVVAGVGARFLDAFRARVEAKAVHNLGDALASLVLDCRAVALADPDSLRVLLDATRGPRDAEVTQLMAAYNTGLYVFVHELLVRAQQGGLVPAQLDLVAATWGFINFFIGVQYRAQMELFDAIPETILGEVNRLWWQSLQIG